MNWTIIISLLILINGFCLLIDTLFGKSQIKKLKEILLELYVNIGDYDIKGIIKSSTGQIVKLFSSVFGDKHITTKCFSRSILSSFIALTISLIIFYGFTDYSTVIKSDVSNYVFWIIVAIFYNLVIDYISLIETRVLLKYVANKNLFFTFLLLIGDFIFSISLYLFSAILAYGFLYLLSGGELSNYIEFIKLYFDKSIFTPFFKVHSLSPFTYSTLFTSVLFYVLTLSNLVLKMLSIMKISINQFIDWFSNKEKPFQSIGYVFSSIVLIIKALIDLT